MTYNYKSGQTKSLYNKFKILTVQNVIALNSLLYIEKVRNFPNILPLSISNLISPNAQTNTSAFESSSSWLENFYTPVYWNSIFYKGPFIPTGRI